MVVSLTSLPLHVIMKKLPPPPPPPATSTQKKGLLKLSNNYKYYQPHNSKQLLHLQQQLLNNNTSSFHSFQQNHYPFQTISDFNHMLIALLASNQEELAFKFISSSSYHLDLDAWTYSIIITTYCRNGDPFQANNILDLMIQSGFQPKVSTFTHIINSFCKRGKNLDKAYEILELMGRLGCDPTINTYNCLLKGLCYVGRVEQAYQLLLKINNSSSTKPDIYTYTAVMDGFCKVGRSDEALELLQEALHLGLTPTVVTFNTLLNGFFKQGKPLEGIQLLKRMKDNHYSNCMPDYISYSTLLHGLLKWGETPSALMIYNEMVTIGYDVDERMLNTLLRQLCRQARKENDLLKIAYQLFDTMTNRACVIYPATLELVVEAFCMGKEMHKAIMNLSEVIRLGYFPKSYTFINVIRVLCDESKFKEAIWVQLVLCGGNRLPNRMGFNILINKLNKQGMSVAACCVYGVALKRGIVPVHKPKD